MPVQDRERERESRASSVFSEVQNVASYQVPGILASVKGRPVRLIATGDAPGHSPVVQYVDEDGRIHWEDMERVTIIDSQYLPPSPETLREVMRAFTR